MLPGETSFPWIRDASRLDTLSARVGTRRERRARYRSQAEPANDSRDFIFLALLEISAKRDAVVYAV